MRRLFILIILFLGVGFVISNLARLESVADAFAHGDWRILLVALGLAFLWLLNLAATYRAIYRSLGVEERLLDMFLLASAASFTNVVTPSGVLGGVALFMDRAFQHGYSRAKATLAGVMQLMIDLLSFLTVLVVGLIVLVRRNDLNEAEIYASFILILLVAVLVFLMVLGLRSGEELGRALGGFARQLNRLLRPFLRREYLSIDRATQIGRDSALGLQEIRRNASHLAWVYLLALNNKAILIAIFWLMFVAFGAAAAPGTIIAGFSVAFLFTVVAPTPAGIGIVEGVLPLSLSSMYVPLQSATVITLAYRGLTFWLPLFWGMFCMRLLGSKTVGSQDIEKHD